MKFLRMIPKCDTLQNIVPNDAKMVVEILVRRKEERFWSWLIMIVTPLEVSLDTHLAVVTGIFTHEQKRGS